MVSYDNDMVRAVCKFILDDSDEDMWEHLVTWLGFVCFLVGNGL
jgi:hypothetical protein